MTYMFSIHAQFHGLYKSVFSMLVQCLHVPSGFSLCLEIYTVQNENAKKTSFSVGLVQLKHCCLLCCNTAWMYKCLLYGW